MPNPNPVYYQQARHDLAPYLPPKVVRMLDVGCGEGGFGLACKQQYQCEAWGIERDAEAARLAAERLDRVLVGDANELARQLPGDSFDLIGCNDVLEHLAEPEELLVELRRTLTADGCVVASIPNIRFHFALRRILFDKEFPRDSEGIFDRTHLRFFTYKTIRRMFEECGYEVLRLEGINPHVDQRFRRVNRFLLGALDDCRYLQFACLAIPQKKGQAQLSST